MLCAVCCVRPFMSWKRHERCADRDPSHHLILRKININFSTLRLLRHHHRAPLLSNCLCCHVTLSLHQHAVPCYPVCHAVRRCLPHLTAHSSTVRQPPRPPLPPVSSHPPVTRRPTGRAPSLSALSASLAPSSSITMLSEASQKFVSPRACRQKVVTGGRGWVRGAGQKPLQPLDA